MALALVVLLYVFDCVGFYRWYFVLCIAVCVCYRLNGLFVGFFFMCCFVFFVAGFVGDFCSSRVSAFGVFWLWLALFRVSRVGGFLLFWGVCALFAVGLFFGGWVLVILFGFFVFWLLFFFFFDWRKDCSWCLFVCWLGLEFV